MFPRIGLLFCFLLQLLQVPLSLAFSSLDLPISKFASKATVQRYLVLRGGEGAMSEATNTDNAGDNGEATRTLATKTTTTTLQSISAIFLAGAQLYSQTLEKNPIITKSITAGCIFAVSDLIAQSIEKSADKAKVHDKKRTIAASLVGLLYFGPAAHFWYDNIFKLFPGTSLFSTLQKAAMGQMFFGPSFTCIFFATSLLQAGNFSLGNWFRKIKSDLAGAWLAGAGFWPLVDLVSYSLIPMQFIPLFVNVCSLVWNIYLSIVANRKTKDAIA